MGVINGLKAEYILALEQELRTDVEFEAGVRALADTALENRIAALERGREIVVTPLPGPDARRFAAVNINKTALVIVTQASHPLRARWYPTEAMRTADVDRPVTRDPDPGAGCLLEVLFTPDLLDISLTPVAHLYTFDGFSTVYLTVDTEETGAVDVGVMYYPIEA